MSAGVFRQLSRPRTAADRQRFRQMAFGVAGSGAMLLASLAILTVPSSLTSSTTCDLSGCVTVSGAGGIAPVGLSDYVAQDGLRGGTSFGALLMVVPFVLFAVQALRTGTAARERRLAALSLAGATGQDLRRLAFLEGTRAAAVGALMTGPAYLVLWFLLGVALPMGSRMLPVPNLWVLAGWVVLLLVLPLAGGLLARQAARPAAVSPLGLSRRQARPLGPVDVVGPVLSVVLAGIGFLLLMNADHEIQDFDTGFVGILVMMIAAVALAVTGSPWLIHVTARRAIKNPELVTSMAGRRLLADVRTPGRVAGVMLAVGIVFGIIAAITTDVMTMGYGYGVFFYLGGLGAAAACAVLAAVLATSSLVVGATEQILDSARSTAVLVALAASPVFVLKIVRRQMMLAAVPAAVLGSLLGSGIYLPALFGTQDGSWMVVTLPIAVLAAGLSAGIGARVAARAVRPAVLSSSTADNLRTA